MNDQQYVDKLILEKEFFELTAEEKALVLTEVENEQDFYQLKSTLKLVLQEDGEWILPQKTIKKNLLTYMRSKQEPKSGIWLNTFWAWLMPPDKPYYGRPALQFLTLTAIVLFIVILIPVNNPSVADLALNTIPSEESQKTEVIDKNIGLEEERIAEEVASESGQNDSEESMVADKSEAKEALLQRDVMLISENAGAISTKTEAFASGKDVDKDHQAEALAEDQVITGFTAPTTVMMDEVTTVTLNSSSSEKSAALAPAQSFKKSKIGFAAPDKSRSLNEDREFISLLFTAM